MLNRDINATVPLCLSSMALVILALSLGIFKYWRKSVKVTLINKLNYHIGVSLYTLLYRQIGLQLSSLGYEVPSAEQETILMPFQFFF